jgi:PAS domain-containing protein
VRAFNEEGFRLNEAARPSLQAYALQEDLCSRLREPGGAKNIVPLRASEKHDPSLVDILPDGVGLIGLDGRIANANPQAEAMLGFADREELLRKNILDLIQPEDRG